jgi:2-dehydro-3-deoxyglucarate aldolase/4-hydroxy-2-oxoheptanedioate aldolase
MKQNRFRQMLAEGQSPVGHMLFEFASHGMAQILDAADVDFVVIDMEHGSFGMGDVAALVAWLQATRIAPFIRIPQVQYHFIARALDAGVLGVVAPNVRTPAEARALVAAAKYPPMGERGLFFGGASSEYRSGDANAHRQFSNENTTVICMIESAEGVEHVEEIAATPGVDALWVGHWDLSQFMGIPGQFQDERFRAAVRRITEAASRRNLAAVIQPGDEMQLREFVAQGFRVISWSADFYLYRDALAGAVRRVREVLG